MPTLLVFTRWPEPGATKTRLIPVLGAQGAAELQRRLTAATLDAARAAAAALPGLRVEVRFAGGDAERMAALFGPDLAYVEQGDGDLGARLARAFEAAFDAGGGPVAAIGADCPGLVGPFLVNAFATAGPGRAVIGPAADGGYTLLALAAPAPSLFEAVDWGSDRVLAQTRARAEGAGLQVGLLAELADVDRPEDLVGVAHLLPGGSAPRI